MQFTFCVPLTNQGPFWTDMGFFLFVVWRTLLMTCVKWKIWPTSLKLSCFWLLASYLSFHVFHVKKTMQKGLNNWDHVLFQMMQMTLALEVWHCLKKLTFLWCSTKAEHPGKARASVTLRGQQCRGNLYCGTTEGNANVSDIVARTNSHCLFKRTIGSDSIE